MVRSDRLAETEDRRSFIHESDVARDPEGSERAFVVLALDDDGRAPVPLDELFEDAMKVLLQLLPVHHRPPRFAGSESHRRRIPDIGALMKNDEAIRLARPTASYIARRIRNACRARRR